MTTRVAPRPEKRLELVQRALDKRTQSPGHQEAPAQTLHAQPQSSVADFSAPQSRAQLETAQGGADPQLNLAQLLSSVMDAAQHAVETLQTAERYRPDPVVPAPDWRSAVESAQRRLSAAEDIFGARGFTEQLAQLAAKRAELEHAHRRLEHRERMVLAVEKLTQGEGTVEDVQALLAPNGTFTEQRNAWGSLPMPSEEALHSFLGNCVNLAPADSGTARVLRRMLKTTCDPEVYSRSWVSYVGTDVTFREAANPDALLRDRVIAVRLQDGETRLVFENRGELSVEDLTSYALSVYPLNGYFAAPQKALEEHERLAKDLPPERTKELTQSVAKAHEFLDKQNERCGLPPQPDIAQVLWSREAKCGVARGAVDWPYLVTWAEVNPSHPNATEVRTIVHELSHCESKRQTHTFSHDGLRLAVQRTGLYLSAQASLDKTQALAPQEKRTKALAGSRHDVYTRAPIPKAMKELIDESHAPFEEPIEERLRTAQAKNEWLRVADCGRWTSEYLVDLGAILAVDPELTHFVEMNWSAYSEGIRQLAAVYKLAAPEQRIPLERAIVMAGRGSNKHELIRFAATVLDEEQQAYFRSHLEDALADPGLGGLLDAMARANPATQELAELLWGPLPGMTQDAWQERFDELAAAIEPWVANALYRAMMDRWEDRPRLRFKPPDAMDQKTYVQLKQLEQLERCCLEEHPRTGQLESKPASLGNGEELASSILLGIQQTLAFYPELKGYVPKKSSDRDLSARQFAAVYELASPKQRLALERAIVLASRFDQQDELLHFTASLLRDEEQAFFQDHLGNALEDPGLGGLLDAMARANPATQEIAELLWGPLPGMTREAWQERFDGLAASLEPWVAEALSHAMMDRWEGRPRLGFKPPDAIDKGAYLHLKQLAQLERCYLMEERSRTGPLDSEPASGRNGEELANKRLLGIQQTLAYYPDLKGFVLKPTDLTGLRQFAAVYELASPQKRLELERAIVLASRFNQRDELLQFIASLLSDEEQALFRDHLDDVMDDRELGGLLQAMARANPATRELAELLDDPFSVMKTSSWKSRFAQLQAQIQPQWVGEALESIALNRWWTERLRHSQLSRLGI